MSPFEEVLCLPPGYHAPWCVAELGLQIRKAPPFLLWLTSGDIDLPQSVLVVSRASFVMSLLASSSLTSSNEPTTMGKALPVWTVPRAASNGPT